MKATEAKAYILKAKKRIDVIQEELRSISDYKKAYKKECDSLIYKIKSIGTENYVRLHKELEDKYNEYDNNAIRENILKVELKNIQNMMINAAAVCLLDELSKQPEKAINKPIHYKVFKEAFDNAKEKAWGEFKWIKCENWKGEEYYNYPFNSYISKGNYSPDFTVYIDYCGYSVYLSQFVNNYNYILDIESAKSHVENLLIIDIEEIKILVIEGLKTEEEFSRKAVMLEEERIAAMKKFSCISISA